MTNQCFYNEEDLKKSIEKTLPADEYDFVTPQLDSVLAFYEGRKTIEELFQVSNLLTEPMFNQFQSGEIDFDALQAFEAQFESSWEDFEEWSIQFQNFCHQCKRASPFKLCKSCQNMRGLIKWRYRKRLMAS